MPRLRLGGRGRPGSGKTSGRDHRRPRPGGARAASAGEAPAPLARARCEPAVRSDAAGDGRRTGAGAGGGDAAGCSGAAAAPSAGARGAARRSGSTCRRRRRATWPVTQTGVWSLRASSSGKWPSSLCWSAQVVGGAVAAAPEAGRVAAGGEDPLDRPGGRLGVDGAVAAEREAAVRRAAPCAGRRGRGRPPSSRATAPAATAPVPSAVLGEPGSSPQPPSSFWTLRSQSSVAVAAAVGPGGAQGDHREGGRVRPALVGAVVAALGEQPRDEVVAAEVARVDAGALEGEDRAGEVAGAR